MPVAEARADGEDEIALEKQLVGERMARLDPDRARPQGMIRADGALTHQGRADREARVDGRLIRDRSCSLHVEREVDEHRSRPPRARNPKRLAKDPRQLRGLANLHRPLRHRRRDRDDVDRLKCLLVQHRGRCLTGDADDRHRIGERRIQPGDHVRARRPGRADADARVSGDPCPAVRCMGSAFLVPDRQMTDPS
ncbi:MAG TPA: hypothetical protein VMU39_03195 [Solirubrobacteraceae bacterium]|nr:hypothetical protein [Solirubrobacteraceae bacterium]